MNSHQAFQPQLPEVLQVWHGQDDDAKLEEMLVSGADLGFVAAAAQSWSIPAISPDANGKFTTTTRDRICVSVALLVLAVLLNIGQALIVTGSLPGKLILVWLIAETVFYLISRAKYSSVNKVVDVPLEVERVNLIKQRFLTLANFMTLESFLSGWFFEAPIEDIHRENVEEFVAYGFYCRTMEELPLNLRQSVADFVVEIEGKFGQKLKEGRNARITFMAHLWEPLRSYHTPLCVYMVSESAAALAHAVLYLWGFSKLECQGVSYWWRAGARDTDSSPQASPRSPLAKRSVGQIRTRGDSASSFQDLSGAGETPIVFAHGVGFGIMPYLGFLWQMIAANAEHPMIFLDVPHVALRMFRRAKRIDGIAAATEAILRRHHLQKACFVGHSFGSFCISRTRQLFPQIVDSIVLLDPVCCMTCFPQLLHSFVYKAIPMRECMTNLMGLAHGVRYVFSRDLIISETFCRQFLWHELMLWPEDMPAKTVVSCSVNDDLVPSNLVGAHLKATKSPAKFLLHPTAAHGGIFLDAGYQKKLINHIKSFVTEKSHTKRRSSTC